METIKEKLHNAITEIAHLFYQSDQAFQTISEAYPREFVCQKGCSDCCHAIFDVSFAEAVYIYNCYVRLDKEIQKILKTNSTQAITQWIKLCPSSLEEISKKRIRCPLLTETDECACYLARPINCRTYGVPTQIGDAGHVCGHSGFITGKKYQTLNLSPLQERLLHLSKELAGEKNGNRRWSIAEVILDRDDMFKNFLI